MTTTPIIINNVTDLQAIQNDPTGYYVLGANIDAAGFSFTPIGSAANPFTGIFDGQGYAISNLTINNVSNTDTGLFGDIGATGTVRNVGLIDETVTSSQSNVGGLAGENLGTVSQSYMSGTVTGGGFVGALVGLNGSSGSITESFATGAANGINDVGGLVGLNAGEIAKSYATGAINYGRSGLGIGGLVGVMTAGTITQSYAIGLLGGGFAVGGLDGAGGGANVTASYWDTQTTGRSTSADGTGLTTAQLQSGVLPAGFDPTIWSELVGQFPELRWQTPTVDTTAPTVSSITALTDNGLKELNTGHVVTITVGTSEVVNVIGTPTLQLNDNEVATYVGGTGTNALTFAYTVQQGDAALDLQVAGLNLPNGATVQDGAGNNLSGPVAQDLALKIDTTDPVVTSASASPSSGDLNAGHVVAIALSLSGPVKVKGVPTLSSNDGGTANYKAAASNPAAGILVFNYIVKATENTPNLGITNVNTDSVGASVKDTAGHVADFTNALTTFNGLQIDTAAPTISSIVTSGAGIDNGDGYLGLGSIVTLTITFSELVNVATNGGIPTLNLNDGGKAIYAGGSGTNALSFTYTVAAKQITPDLAVHGLALNGGLITDGAGNKAVLSGAITNPIGILQIDGIAPVVNEHLSNDTGVSHTDLITSNDTLTGRADPNALLHFTVDGLAVAATATADSTGKWTFTPPSLLDGQHTIVATEIDGGGNTGAVLLTFTLDTTAPTVLSVTNNATNDSLSIGDKVTITLGMSEPVTVAGVPTLKLNDGATARYVSGTGTSALVFDYTVMPGEHTSDLTVTGIGKEASIHDLAGNALTSTVTRSLGLAVQAPSKLEYYYAANVVYADNAIGTQSGTAPPVETGLTVLLDSRDPSLDGSSSWLSHGFFAQAFADSSGNVIISFEGSIINPLNSLDPSFWTPYAVGSRVADAQILAGLIPQAFLDAESFALDVNRYLAQHGLSSSPIYLTGHSLGGAEAQDVAYIIGDTSGVTFGAPGTPDLSAPVSAPNFIDYVDYGDPVGQFGAHFGTIQLVGPLSDSVVEAELGLLPATALYHPPEHYAADLGLHPSVPLITVESLSKTGEVLLSGFTAEANDAISIYDGTTLLGATTTASNGGWNFVTSPDSNAVHVYTATGTDGGGNVGFSSNEAILGSQSADTLIGTAGNDIIKGNGGSDTITGGLGADTLAGGSGRVSFSYKAIQDSTPSSHDTITDFVHAQDFFDFTNIAGINAVGNIPAFQGNLSGSGNTPLEAHSIGYIEVNGNTEVLINSTNATEIITSSNVSSANMEIVLTGIHLGLTSADFHLV